ncbi:SAF domain-containing protein [Thermophilibacter immobilis]|jgi:pilus assembly protein CpaB|uniref:SAF domain-containing protein n=1 Tax=Thermophilibacter immobilis TaxID=2779519 RepID=A0A7S7RUX2_9ACTN|nr:SAF domain-containing protein [Thermophilibacter immobilis]QOY61008.1 hypothetical protein INP52_01995 [Thermophilibacter immobilis]
MTRRLRFVLSGALALLAAVLCASYGQHVRDEADRVRAEALERYGGEVVNLVVASDGLEAGDIVDRQSVVERDWIFDLAPEGAVTDLESVLGTEVTVPVAAGAPLTSLNFRDDADAVEVPSGRVALSVPVTDKLALPSSVAAGGMLVAYEVQDAGTKVVSSSLQVLRAPGEQTTVGSHAAITLAALPDDVAPVLAASAQGSLRLALPADDVTGLSGESKTAPTVVSAESAKGDGA